MYVVVQKKSQTIVIKITNPDIKNPGVIPKPTSKPLVASISTISMKGRATVRFSRPLQLIANAT